jgi:hypothetical protein
VFSEAALTEDMQRFWRENPIATTEDLRWMPSVPFRYYMLGFRDFVLHDDFGSGPLSHAPDAASCFLNLILRKLESAPSDIAPIIDELLPAGERIATNQSSYRANPEIDGDFRTLFARIQELTNR